MMKIVKAEDKIAEELSRIDRKALKTVNSLDSAALFFKGASSGNLLQRV